MFSLYIECLYVRISMFVEYRMGVINLVSDVVRFSTKHILFALVYDSDNTCEFQVFTRKENELEANLGLYDCEQEFFLLFSTKQE